MALMIDWDALWWCNPDYVGLPKAIGGIIPVALFVALAFCYFSALQRLPKARFGVAYRGGLSGAVANDVVIVASCRERMACDCGLLWDSDAHQRFPDASVWCCHDSCGHSGSSRACCRACCYCPGFVVDIDGFVYSFPVDWLFVTAGIGKFSNAYKQNGWCVTASCKMCQFCIKETGLLNDGCYGMASAAALTRSDLHCLIQR